MDGHNKAMCKLSMSLTQEVTQPNTSQATSTEFASPS